MELGIFLFFVLLFVLLVMVIWKNYWKLQIIYNSSIVSFHTPDHIFPISKKNKKRYNSDIFEGKHYAKTKRVVICSMLMSCWIKFRNVLLLFDFSHKIFEREIQKHKNYRSHRRSGNM